MARPTISLQAAIGPGAGITNLFIIGTSLIGGTDVIGGLEIVGQGSWQEIGDRCSQVSTRRGRQRQLEQYNAGTLGAVLDNTDGALDPSWTTGPYSDGGGVLQDEGSSTLLDEGGGTLYDEGGSAAVSRVQPFAGVHLAATWNGLSYDIYTGFADAWRPIYRYPEGGLVELAATDAFKIFTRINNAADVPQGGGDTSGARIGRILDEAGWSTTLRDIEDGDATHQETTLGGVVADQMRITADSERGDLYIGPDGKVVFKGWQYRYVNGRSYISQWTIGDGDTEMNPASFVTINDDTLVKNDVRVARVGGVEVVAQDPTIVTTPYLWATYTRSDLTLEDDLQVARYAERVLRIFKDQKERVDSVTFEPDGYDDLWPLVLGAQFGDRVTINLRHPYTGQVFTGDYYIEGVDHDIPVLEAGGKWVTTFYLSDASAYPTGPFIIGSSLIGGTDVIV